MIKARSWGKGRSKAASARRRARRERILADWRAWGEAVKGATFGQPDQGGWHIPKPFAAMFAAAFGDVTLEVVEEVAPGMYRHTIRCAEVEATS